MPSRKMGARMLISAEVISQMTAQRFQTARPSPGHGNLHVGQRGKCWPGVFQAVTDSKTKGILQSQGQRSPCPQPSRASCVHVKGQARPRWGWEELLPEPGPTCIPGPLFSLSNSPDDHLHVQFLSSLAYIRLRA